MKFQIIFSGTGGQGMMFIGKLLANLAMDKFPHVTFFPSYGAEVRGGTSNCQIIVSDKPIASPIVDAASLQILMNQPSVNRFVKSLAVDGTVLVNSSLACCDDQRAMLVPASQIAGECGSAQQANVVIFAAALKKTDLLDRQKARDAVVAMASRKGDKAAQAAAQAFDRGWNFQA